LLLSVAVSAALSYFVLASTQFTAFFAGLSAAAGGSAAGYIYGKFRRRYGLLGGAACGAVLYAAVSLVGLFAVGTPADIRKLLLLTVAGAAGGVMGVNSARPKRLTD
jgi:putative membrane protein (TIGR04086 family)